MEAATLTLAEHYLEIGRPDRALAALESGQADVSDADFWRLRGTALLGLDRHGEALAAATSGLAVDPDDIALLALHASASKFLGDIRAAERSLLAALRLDPENDWLLTDYALLVARAGQLEKARQLIDEAARIDPLSEHVAAARTILAHLEGDDARAAAHAAEMLAADPEGRAAHVFRGFTLSAQGRSAAARRHFETAARYDPGDTDIVDAARETRDATHPLLLPLAPIARWGGGPVWLAAVALIGLTWAIGNVVVMLVVTWTWLFYVAYSWIVPPLLRAWLRRKRA